MNFTDTWQDYLDEESARRKAAAYKQDSTNIEETKTSMPRMGFEPTFPVLEKAKTFRASDHADTVIGELLFN
jgi:hypothetical protein